EDRHDGPAGTKTPRTATAGGIVGGLAAGLVGVVFATTNPGETVLVESLFIGAGASFGTFVGAMMSRGMEREVANYYDQALRRGQILVSAEMEEGDDRSKLDRAEQVFEEAGSHPVALPAG